MQSTGDLSMRSEGENVRWRSLLGSMTRSLSAKGDTTLGAMADCDESDTKPPETCLIRGALLLGAVGIFNRSVAIKAGDSHQLDLNGVHSAISAVMPAHLSARLEITTAPVRWYESPEMSGVMIPNMTESTGRSEHASEGE